MYPKKELNDFEIDYCLDHNVGMDELTGENLKYETIAKCKILKKYHYEVKELQRKLLLEKYENIRDKDENITK